MSNEINLTVKQISKLYGVSKQTIYNNSADLSPMKKGNKILIPASKARKRFAAQPKKTN